MLAFLNGLWLRLRHRSARTPQHSTATMRHRTTRIDTAWLHTAAHPAHVDHITRVAGRAPVNQRG